MPRLVRRQPLLERIKAALDPYDLYLWISEELHESSWEESLNGWTTPIGAALNVLFIITRANSGGTSSGTSDVFGDFEGNTSSGWFTWLCTFLSHLLALLAVLNAVQAFTKTKAYRLFENSIEERPATTSAKRVNINSSPSSGSPFSKLSSFVSSKTAWSRAHPDQTRDVWEVSVWDPKEFHLSLFALFSPGHVLIYWLFLPTHSSDPQPSVTIATSILLSALFTLQLVIMQLAFQRQQRDLRVINKEVQNEYDTKYVHPNLHRPMRDVATQTIQTSSGAGTSTREVDTYTPTVIINRGFTINPNPSYASHLSDDSSFSEIDSPLTGRLPRSTTAPNLHTPTGASGTLRQFASPLGKAPVLTTPSRPSISHRQTSPTRGDGGSLGVYTHAESPLRKTVSMNRLTPGSRLEPGSAVRKSSPLKLTSTPGGSADPFATGRDSSKHRFSSFR